MILNSNESYLTIAVDDDDDCNDEDDGDWDEDDDWVDDDDGDWMRMTIGLTMMMGIG